MCMKREYDGSDRLLYPFPLFDFIDLTMEDFVEENSIEMTPRNDQWNYPYNLLPSSDEEESTRGFVDNIDDSTGEFNYTETNASDNLSNETNQITNLSSTILNNTESNGTDQSSEGREFEINIPQILLSMSRIPNILLDHTTSQD